MFVSKIVIQMFETKIWPKIAHKGDCKGLEPSLVLLEILSYIKGSAEAIQSAKGYLNDGNYMQVLTMLNTLEVF